MSELTLRCVCTKLVDRAGCSYFVNFDILLLQTAIRSMFKSLTVFYRGILSLHLFLNAETLLLGEKPHVMTLMTLLEYSQAGRGRC